MKNLLNLIAVTVLVTVIGFTMLACGGDGNGDSTEKVTITYDLNYTDAPAAPAAKKIDKGAAITDANLPAVTRTDYVFNGWFTTPTAGTQINADTIFDNDATIYAQWEPEIYPLDFTSHFPPSITVRNNTNQRLVAFRGTPHIDNLMGGIPENAVNHGLSRSGFTQSRDFPLTILTETEFHRAWGEGKNQALANAEILNVIYAFYNHNGINNNVFAINSQSSEIGRLILENPTAWNIELRKDAYNGETLGYIAPYTTTQTLNLEPSNYNFYPVMRRFNNLLLEIIDAHPVFPNGVIASTPFFKPLQISSTSETWNFRELAQNTTARTVNMVSGGAFIRVVNNNSEAAISFYNGTVVQQTSMASTFLNPGQTMIFQVAFPRNPDGSFSNTHTTDFGIGVAGGSRTADVPPKTITLDYFYEIAVTGDASNVVASEIREIQKMDMEGLFAANVN